MNKDKFNKLSPEDQEIVFDEMLELINLVYNNPITVDELKIFTEWHKWTGRHNQELSKLLIGVYPYPSLDEYKNEEELNNLLQYSNDALLLVKFWNEQIKHKINLCRLK